MKAKNPKTLNKKPVIFRKIMHIFTGKFYEFFWHPHLIQSEILLRKLYFEYFFQANGRQVVQIKAKNPETDEYLKWKITWEIGKVNFLKNLHVGNFVFGSDPHLVVHRRHSHEKIRSIWHFHNKCFKTHRDQLSILIVTFTSNIDRRRRNGQRSYSGHPTCL